MAEPLGMNLLVVYSEAMFETFAETILVQMAFVNGDEFVKRRCIYDWCCFELQAQDYLDLFKMWIDTFYKIVRG